MDKKKINRNLSYYFVFKHRPSFMDFFLREVWGRKKYYRYYYQLPMQLFDDIAVYGGRSFGKSVNLEGRMLYNMFNLPDEESLLTALRTQHIKDRCENLISFIYGHRYLREWVGHNRIGAVTRSPYYRIKLKNNHHFHGIAATDDPRAITVQGLHPKCVPSGQKIRLGDGRAEYASAIYSKWVSGEEIYLKSYDFELRRVVSKKMVYAKEITNNTKPIKVLLSEDNHVCELTGDHEVFVSRDVCMRANRQVENFEKVEAVNLKSGDKIFVLKKKKNQGDCEFFVKEMKLKTLVPSPSNSEVVYDFQVEDTNNFFVGDFLVSNCRYIEETQFFTIDAWNKLVPAASPTGCSDIFIGVKDGLTDSVFRKIYDDMDKYRKLEYTTYSEPHYTLKVDDEWAQSLGGRDSDEYKQGILALWGSPAWSAWDIDVVINSMIDGTKMLEIDIKKKEFLNDKENGNPFATLSKLVKVNDSTTILGIDVGQSEPTPVVVLSKKNNSDTYVLHTIVTIDGRLVVENQALLIDYLADYFNASLISIDTTEGGGKAIASILQNENNENYKNKDYKNRIVWCGYNEVMVVEYRIESDNNGKGKLVEIKEPVKDYTHFLCHNMLSEGKLKFYNTTTLIKDFEKEKKVRHREKIRIKTPDNVHIPDALRCFAKAWFESYGEVIRPKMEIKKQKFVYPIWEKGVNIFGK